MTAEYGKISAIGVNKWLNCPGSIVLEAQMPQSESQGEKEEKAARALGAAKIRLARKEFNRAKYKKAIKMLDITEEMEQYTDDYSEFVIKRFNLEKNVTEDAILVLEQELNFSKFVPDGFGKADAVIIGDGKVEIICLQYGKGVEVEAHSDAKLKLYGVGALAEFDYLYGIERIKMTSYEPHTNNISSWEMTAQALVQWANTEVLPRAQKAYMGTEEFCVGKYCEEECCKARPICRAYAQRNLELNAYSFKEPYALTTEEVGKILEQAEGIAKWATLVKDFALDQAVNHGVTYAGHKLVEGRSNRTWTVDETLIATQLIGKGYRDDDIWPRKLKGIKALENFLSKKTFKEILGDLVVKPQGKPTLVSVYDKRPEINATQNPSKNANEVLG